MTARRKTNEQRRAHARRCEREGGYDRQRPRKQPLPARREERVPVTDHAVVRYLERVLGVDVEAIRRRIYSEQVREAAVTLVTCTLTIEAGYRAVLRDGVVVTVKPPLKGETCED